MGELTEATSSEQYTIRRTLSEFGRLAIAPGGRRVVLKPVDDDCLLRNQLHPMIKDRLGRVRELAHMGVASLIGVERLEGRATLVWEYVEGLTLEEYAAQHEDEPWLLARVARDLVVSVESLHALGIVHGALHERNIVVMPDGRVVLTHISPLLYNDPDVDVDCLVGLLEFIGWGMKLHGPGLPSFRDMLAHLSSRPSTGTGLAVGQPADAGHGSRRAALVGAIIAALVGILLALGLWQWARRSAQCLATPSPLPERAACRILSCGPPTPAGDAA